MKSNTYYLLNKNERAFQMLCYYGKSAIILSYINLRYAVWDGNAIRLEFGSAVISFKPPITFDVKDFLESIREQWIFEIRSDKDLEIEVYLSQTNLEGLENC